MLFQTKAQKVVNDLITQMNAARTYLQSIKLEPIKGPNFMEGVDRLKQVTNMSDVSC